MNALEAAYLRAGASDQDRAAWLAERARGVTATEVRELALGRIDPVVLARQKLGRVPAPTVDGPYVAWGKEREPVIADDLLYRWGIRPESRVFHAEDEPRFLASPDGLGMSFDEELVGAEIKTSGHDLTPGVPGSMFDESGYGLQVQWNMRVLGARQWLFAWEERHGVPGGFWPGDLHWHWIARDDATIGQLERVARDFLAVLDAEAAEPWEAPDVDPEVDAAAVEYLTGLAEEKAGRERKEAAWQRLLAAGRSQVSAVARVTFKPATVVEVEEIDVDAAKADPEGARLFAALREAEDAWNAHCARFVRRVQVEGKPSLRVTAVKGA